MSAVNGSKQTSTPRQQTDIDRAFALGWHVAELTHLQDDSPRPMEGPGVLKQIVNLDFDGRAKLLVDQITQGIAQLQVPAGSAKLTIPAQLAALQQLTEGRDPLSEADLVRVPSAHETLLTQLTAADYRLGKAYALGTQVGETVLLGYVAVRDGVDRAVVEQLFARERVALIAGQLHELKTEFEDHAADAVSTTLLDWSETAPIWSAESDTAAKRLLVANDLYRQGAAWRSMLSGEKEATDYLNLVDYAKAIGDLLGEYAALARNVGFSGPTLVGAGVLVLLVALATVALDVVVSAQVQAVYTALIGLAATVGITGATITASVKSALATAEGKLWETELSAAVAEAIDYVPVRNPESHVKGLRKVSRAEERLIDYAPLSTSSGRGIERRPVRLGKWIAICMAFGVLVFGGMTYVLIHGGASFGGVISITASAFACYSVSILATVAVINFFAALFGAPYVWALPTHIPRFRTDWFVPIAVALGTVVGKAIWP